MSMYDEALRYVNLGLSVFPIESEGKIPLTEHGFHDASRDPKQVRSWWKKWPNANIGIATGEKSGGIYVIDLDVDEDRGTDGYHVFNDWQKENGEFPDSWIAITGRGGYHLYFKSRHSVSCSTGLLPGVDIRGDGGYVVAPPSIHQNGSHYEWEFSPEEFELAEADDLLEKLLASKKSPARPSGAFQVPEVIKKGERNDILFKTACSFQSKGLPDNAILAAVQTLNKESCETPLPEDEVAKIVASALRYDKGTLEKNKDPDQASFILTNKGEIAQLTANVVTAIETDARFDGAIKYNSLAYTPYVCGSLPWDESGKYREWTNFDDSHLNSYIEKNYGIVNRTKIAEGLDIVISKNRFNPVIDMLNNIHSNLWDGKTGHIENLLPDYLGVDKNVYTTEVMRLLMLGAINRVFTPGCKFDYMPVIVGKQGIGKSTFFRCLALDDQWFDDNFNTVDGDKACEKLRGMWIVELAELLATKNMKGVESIKAFVTSRGDLYRPPYERRTENRPRQCVFVGTTNSERFLTDRTGNRRFLPLIAREEKIRKSMFDDPEEFRQEIINAWGEAMEIYLTDPKAKRLVLSRKASEIARQAQNQATEEDARVGMIQSWLDHTDEPRVCAGMLYQEALRNEDRTPRRSESAEILNIMDNEIAGWHRMEKKAKCGKYGTTICYVRDNRGVDILSGGKVDNSDQNGTLSTGELDGFLPFPDG